jgi:hypothetical protein
VGLLVILQFIVHIDLGDIELGHKRHPSRSFVVNLSSEFSSSGEGLEEINHCVTPDRLLHTLQLCAAP